MNVLTNPIFWLLIGAIVFVMALIGYLAEGTELAKKASKKTEKEDKKPSKAVPDVIPEAVTLNNLVQNTIAPTEQGAPSAWSGEIKKEDEKKETTYEVPAADDWSVMPTSGDLVPPTPAVENTEATGTAEVIENTPAAIPEESVVVNNPSIEEAKGEESASPLTPLLPREEILTPIVQEEKKETDQNIWG